MNVHDVLADLAAEQAALDPMVRGLSATDWGTPTASPRWSVTQRRHLDDVDLETVGEPASNWLSMVQAFAGPPTDGPIAGAIS